MRSMPSRLIISGQIDLIINGYTPWRQVKMSIKEYTVDNSGEFECQECHTTEDIVFDEDGEPICTDCLFEKECGV